MTVMRFDPFHDLDRIAGEMLRGSHTPKSMPMEAYRRGDEFFVHLDVPGVSRDDVELTVEHNVVNIRAERRPSRQDDDEVLVDERPQGTFTRQFVLGENLDTGNISAEYEHGVLTLRIPVSQESKPRRVAIGRATAVPEQPATGSREPQAAGAPGSS